MACEHPVQTGGRPCPTCASEKAAKKTKKAKS